MPERKFQAEAASYRYSINGQEKESELNENITTALYWEYDSRIGRRWNLDPVVKFWQSPYSTFNNNPIEFADPSGLDGVPRKHTAKKNDTYGKLAKKYNVSVSDLRAWNKYKDGSIPIGAEIIVSDPKSPLKIGGSPGKAGIADDAISYMAPKSEKMKELVEEYSTNSTAKLFATLTNVVTTGSFGDGDEAAVNIIVHFQGNTGRDFNDNIDNAGRLSKIMLETPQMQQLFSDVKRQFYSQMTLSNGDYSSIQININRLPYFNAGTSPTLFTLVGGTQQLDVFIKDINVVPGPFGKNIYSGTLLLTLTDIWGVDENDVTKYFSGGLGILKPKNWLGRYASDGLASFWILQHLRGYKPFKHTFSFTVPVNTAYDKPQ